MKNVFILGGVLIVIGIGAFFITQKTTRETQNTSANQPTAVQTQDTAMISVTSKDGRVTFQYPSNWFLQDTTNPAGGSGQFGPIFQSWTLSSFSPTEVVGSDGIPTNSAKIDIEIQEGGGNLSIDQLVDCNGKTITCEKIGIDSEQFIKATGVLNIGAKTISVATFYDDKILKMSAIVSPGPDQDQVVNTVNQIFNSITFSQ